MHGILDNDMKKKLNNDRYTQSVTPYKLIWPSNSTCALVDLTLRFGAQTAVMCQTTCASATRTSLGSVLQSRNL